MSIPALSHASATRISPQKGVQRSGGSITVYEQHLPGLLHALNPAAMDSLILQNGRRGQFSQPTREQMIAKGLEEFNLLAKRVLRMRNKPSEPVQYASGEIKSGEIHVRSRGEELRNPLNPKDARGVYTSAIYSAKRHPENALTFITTTPVGGLGNITDETFRNDEALDVAIVNQLIPKVVPSSYQPTPKNVFDFARYSTYTPER